MKLRTQLLFGFGAVFCVMLVLAGITQRGINAQREATAWREHTYQVIRQALDLEAQLLNMQAGSRGFLLTGVEAYLEPYTSGATQFELHQETLATLVADNPAQREATKRIRELTENWKREVAEPLIAARRQGATDEARRLDLVAKGKAQLDALRVRFKEFVAVEEGLLERRGEAEQRAAERLELVVLLGTLLGIGLGIGALVLVGRGIQGLVGGEPAEITRIAEQVALGRLSLEGPAQARAPVGVLASVHGIVHSLRATVEIASAIAERDLTRSVPLLSDEDALGQALSRMSRNLREQLSDLREVIGVLSVSSAEIRASSVQLAASTAQAGTSVTETSATVEEVCQTSRLADDKAHEVEAIAARASETSRAGLQATEEVIGRMQAIKSQMEAIGESVVQLSERSQAIGEVVATVNDLAEQSNLLAVNASIEAAKAGEHGRGFAVVAQEVRKLAELSKQATKQVRGLLREVQEATSKAAMTADRGNRAVEVGLAQSKSANEAIQELMERSEETALAATQIAASNQQQLVGMEQVKQAMQNIRQASGDIAASTRQSEQSAKELHTLGERLQVMLDQYRL